MCVKLFSISSKLFTPLTKLKLCKNEALKCQNQPVAKLSMATGHAMILFMYVGVLYSGEYDVCGVTLSVHPHRANDQRSKIPMREDEVLTHIP